MNGLSHPLFGRPALALGARVLGVSERTGHLPRNFALEGTGLEDAQRAWLKRHGARITTCAGDQVICEFPSDGWREDQDSAPPIAEHLAATSDAYSTDHGPPQLMAILNATPDSFSDGGKHLDPAIAIAAGLRFIESGAHWLDVGGESTRPGAAPVSPEEECNRVLPVIEGLLQAGAQRVSIDTRNSAVAAAALAAGAHMVNDVGAGLDDPKMLSVVAEAKCDYVLMHRQGQVASMQDAPQYRDVMAEVCQFLRHRVAACLEAGIPLGRLWLDPGIGFGKRLEHNLDLLRRMAELRSLGLPLLVGPSRKSFIGHITGSQKEADWARLEARDNPMERLGGTSAAISFCAGAGVKVLRVHDVAVMAESCAVHRAIQARPLFPLPLSAHPKC